MKKTRLLGFNSSQIFSFLLIFIISMLSDSSLKAENNPIEDYFNTRPTVQHLSNSSIEVGWNIYPDFDYSTHYQVMINHIYYGHSTKSLKQICKNITPGSNIDVRVVTFHKGEFCGISTSTQSIMIPAAPKTISIYDIATSSFGILWSGVESATSYNIYNNETKIGSKEESGLNNKLTLSGFEPGSLLKITMTALNSSGESPKSAPIDVQLKAIASLSLTIPNKSITATSFKIQWEKQEYATGYKILINDAEVATVGADQTEYEVTGLNAGTSVSAKVVLLNSTGEAASSDSIIIQLKPDAPILTATDISSYSCILTWSVANGANNYKIFENGDNAIQNVPSTITNVTIIEGVNAGSTVYYKVRAVNYIGESEDANIVEVNYLPSDATNENTDDNTSSSSAPIYSNRLLSSSFRIPEAHFSDSLKEKNVIAVYFPPELKGAELDLEEEYLEMIAESPELKDVRFYAIFTNEVVKRDKNPENLKFKKAKASDKLVIPGKIPVVRFYAEGGILRSEILISIPIMTVTDVYKALPETLEKRSNLMHLYHE